MKTDRIRVLIVDDSADITRLLARQMRDQIDLMCVGTLPSATGLIKAVRTYGADVVLMDLSMPGPATLPAITALMDAVPACRVIIFSGYDDDASVQAALDAGACALVSKSMKAQGILKMIRKVMAAPVATPSLS